MRVRRPSVDTRTRACVQGNWSPDLHGTQLLARASQSAHASADTQTELLCARTPFVVEVVGGERMVSSVDGLEDFACRLLLRTLGKGAGDTCLAGVDRVATAGRSTLHVRVDVIWGRGGLGRKELVWWWQRWFEQAVSAWAVSQQKEGVMLVEPEAAERK
eukprot:5575961-Pleurochrysis_carterae.AAC.1